MSLYQEMSVLFPYLQSVRKIQTYISFDISFPNTWKIPKKYVEENKIMEQDTQNKNERLFSYVSEIKEDDIRKVHTNLKNIIKYNLELEEKEKLFDAKVEELRKIFEKQNLEKLKGLQFDIKESINKSIIIEDDERENKSIGMVEETDSER